MIHEFAVDPVSVSNWQNFRYLIDKFGVEHGRLISRFPGKWKRMVYDACTENYDSGQTTEIQRTQIEVRLESINNKLVKLNRSYDSKKAWLKNAEEQHSVNEFRAIISVSNPRSHPYILNAYEIDETNPLWDVPRERIVPRKAYALAACAKMLLMISKEIIFVDPHFDPKKERFLATFKYLIQFAFQNRLPERLELHVEYTDKLAPLESWRDDCRKIVPKDFTLKIMRWNRSFGGDKPHPRYVLTEMGGIRYDYGLDEWEGKGQTTTDVSLLDPVVHGQRWKDYHKSDTTFDCIDEIEIKGEYIK